MNNIQIITALLYCYGTFLICCGIASVIFIGLKAKTALISGGTAGTVAIAIAYLVSNQISGASVAGIFWSLTLFCVFSWRSTKTFYKLFELIPSAHQELKGKGVAFLVISLMTVVSIIITILQIAFTTCTP